MARSIDTTIAEKLMQAINNGQSAEALELIKTHSARELYCDDKFTQSGKTPLHHAILENNTGVALALINKEGATAAMAFKKTNRAWDYNTPLHEAVHIRIEKDGKQEIIANKAVVEALINMPGVTTEHLSRKDKHGKTASTIAREAHFNDIAVMIEKKLEEKLGLVQTAMPAPQSQQQHQHHHR